MTNLGMILGLWLIMCVMSVYIVKPIHGYSDNTSGTLALSNEKASASKDKVFFHKEISSSSFRNFYGFEKLISGEDGSFSSKNIDFLHMIINLLKKIQNNRDSQDKLHFGIRNRRRRSVGGSLPSHKSETNNTTPMNNEVDDQSSHVQEDSAKGIDVKQTVEATNQYTANSKPKSPNDSKQSVPLVQVQPLPQPPKVIHKATKKLPTAIPKNDNHTDLDDNKNNDVQNAVSKFPDDEKDVSGTGKHIVHPNTDLHSSSNVTGVNTTGNFHNPPMNMTLLNKYTHRISHTRDVTSATLCVSVVLILLFGMVLHSRMWQKRDQWLTLEEVLQNQAKKSQLPHHTKLTLKDLIENKLKFIKAQMKKMQKKEHNSPGKVRKKGGYKEVHQVESQTEKSGSEDELYSR